MCVSFAVVGCVCACVRELCCCGMCVRVRALLLWDVCVCVQQQLTSLSEKTWRKANPSIHQTAGDTHTAPNHSGVLKSARLGKC